MRRIAATLGLVAVLVAPLHGLAGVALGCDGVRALGECCCPTGEREDDGDRPAAWGLCCCDIEPAVSATSVPVASAAHAASAARGPSETVRDVPAPEAEAVAAPIEAARDPPPAGSLFGQAVALLL